MKGALKELAHKTQSHLQADSYRSTPHNSIQRKIPHSIEIRMYKSNSALTPDTTYTTLKEVEQAMKKTKIGCIENLRYLDPLTWSNRRRGEKNRDREF